VSFKRLSRTQRYERMFGTESGTEHPLRRAVIDLSEEIDQLHKIILDLRARLPERPKSSR